MLCTPPLAVVLFVCLGLPTPEAAPAQQAAPTGYTYVAEWDASRDKWSEITAYAEKSWRPMLKLPLGSGQTEAKHRDYFLRSLIWKGKPGNGSGGYLRVATSAVQPGKGSQWLALGRKYSQPLWDEFVANGTVASYGVQLEHIVTDDPGVRMVVGIFPNAEGLDKAQAASMALTEKRTQAERDAITAEFAAVTIPGAARTYLGRINFYSMK